MPFASAFPESVERDVATALEPRERIHVRVIADLDSDQRFTSVHLAVAQKHVCVAAAGRPLLRLAIADITKASSEELYGSGRLIVCTGDGERVIAYFTRHLVPEMAATARAINELIAGREPVLPTDIDTASCTRCGAPLAERGTNCPLCVPRRQILMRLIGLLKPFKWRALALVGITLLGVVTQMLAPLTYKAIVDRVLTEGRHDELALWAGLMLGAAIGGLLFRFAGNSLTSWLSGRVVADLQGRLHVQLSRLRMSYHGRREAGELVGRVMNDSMELLHFLKDGFPYLLVNVLSFLTIATILILLSPTLALIVFVPVPLLMLGGAWFWKKLIPLRHKRGNRVGRLHSLLSESIRGIKVVKALTQEGRRSREFDHINDQLFRTTYLTDRTFNIFYEFLALVMAIGAVAVWYLGAKGIIASGGQHPSLGDLMAFVAYIAMFYGPLQWFTAVLNWMSSAFAGAERIFNLLDQVPEPDVAADAPEAAAALPKVAGAIEFRDVHFSYERGKEVLKGVDIAVGAGEMLGLVGKSGAGKSTIISLLCRFYEPDLGEIILDGRPLSSLPLARYRRHVGIVMQDPFLFRGSVVDNIRYGKPDATFAEVVEAAKAAHCHDFILEKEDGYDTVVGDGGIELSGGERQRLSIARAIVHDPPILILDEATSAVDSDTEKQIQEAIARLVKGRTTIAIAHRLATLRNANRLVVIDDGKVIEQGTHDELMAKDGGHFARLVRLQTEINKLKTDQIVTV
jgi:ATP-binding cassette, subfamily B, bacterial